MSRLLTSDKDGQWIEVEGIVHSATDSGKNEVLDLVLEDGRLSAVTVKRSGVDYERFVDARITLRGNEAPLFNHRGQLTGAHIFFPDDSTIQVLDPAPPDPFAMPVDSIESLLRYVPTMPFTTASICTVQ